VDSTQLSPSERPPIPPPRPNLRTFLVFIASSSKTPNSAVSSLSRHSLLIGAAMEAMTMTGSLFSTSSVFQPSSSLSHPKPVTLLSINSTRQAQKATLSISNARFISLSKKSSRSLLKCSPSVAVEAEAEIPIEKSKL
jgi:hypothetical protein